VNGPNKTSLQLGKNVSILFQDSSFFMQLVMVAFTHKGGIAITMVSMNESGSSKIETMKVGDFSVEECLFCQKLFVIFKIQSWEM